MKTIAALLFAAINLMYAAVFGGPVDGTAWDIKVKQDGFFHWSTTRDSLVFHDGKAVIAGEVAKGYSPALYEARDDSNGTDFSVTLADASLDQAEWTGHINGERISGAVIVRGKDGRNQRFTFSGSRKHG